MIKPMSTRDRIRVVLVEVRSGRRGCVNRDFMAGYGWAFNVGASWRARLIEAVQKFGERLPLISYGHLSSFFRRAGHEVLVGAEVPPNTHLVIIQIC